VTGHRKAAILSISNRGKKYECRRHEEELKELEKNHKHTAKCPDLRAEVKNWITDHRKNRISVSKKHTVF
jgi:hypothetical protein